MAVVGVDVVGDLEVFRLPGSVERPYAGFDRLPLSAEDQFFSARFSRIGRHAIE